MTTTKIFMLFIMNIDVYSIGFLCLRWTEINLSAKNIDIRSAYNLTYRIL